MTNEHGGCHGFRMMYCTEYIICVCYVTEIGLVGTGHFFPARCESLVCKST